MLTKTLITSYTFNAAAKTVTFTGFTAIDLERVMLITNTTTQAIIYNFADPANGGTVSTNVLTLEHDTTAMNNADKLQIIYWVKGADTATDVSAASAATSAQVLAANPARTGLLLTNTDANTCYLYYGTTASSSKFTVPLAPGAYWEMPQPIWKGRIDAIWSADGAGSLIGTELAN